MTRHAIDVTVTEAAFERLSPLHQQLLLWRFLDELTYEEMAARLGISQRKLVQGMGAMIHAWCNAVEDVQAGPQ